MAQSDSSDLRELALELHAIAVSVVKAEHFVECIARRASQLNDELVLNLVADDHGVLLGWGGAKKRRSSEVIGLLGEGGFEPSIT